MRRILVIDDEDSLRHMLTVYLAQAGYDVATVDSAEAALAELGARDYDCALCDVRMPRASGLDLLDELARLGRTPLMIMMSAYGSNDLALDAVRRGAYDYVAKPFRPEEIVFVLKKAEERERLRLENDLLRRALAARPGTSSAETPFCGMAGRSARMQEIFRTLHKVAEYKTNVLVCGESGTGKELVVRALHDLSPRASRPFVAVNCGAIPENLLESELFGHRKGAFTDATRDKKGLFAEADGGTLFLDEIGELPLGLQVKLLRALQEEKIYRLGDEGEISVDVRVVAATLRDLAVEVAAGRFREDLYYRLNVVAVTLPPLRERREDIPALVDLFVRRYEEKHRHARPRIEGVAPAAMQALLDYDWPGNVRELENTIERAVVLSEGARIEAGVLEDRIRAVARPAPAVVPAQDLSIKKATRAIEEELIRRALVETRGNRTNAAKLLEISHRALLYKIREYGLGRDGGAA